MSTYPNFNTPYEAFIRALQAMKYNEREIGESDDSLACELKGENIGLDKAISLAKTMLGGGTEQQLREALNNLVEYLSGEHGKPVKVYGKGANREVVGGQPVIRDIVADALKALALPAGQPDEGVVDDGLAVEDITEDLKAYIRSLPIKADLQKCAREE